MTAPTLFEYREVVGPDIIEELTILASHVGNRSIRMVNSTAVGGGVAEMLLRIVPLLNEMGIQTTWSVVEGDDEFFEITKRFHNALQGQEGQPPGSARKIGRCKRRESFPPWG